MAPPYKIGGPKKVPKTIGLFCPPHPFRKTGDNLSCFKRPVRHKNRPQKNRSCRVLNYIKLRDDNWGTIFGGGRKGSPGVEGGRKPTRTKTWNLGVPRWPVWSVWSAGSGPRRERGRLQKKNKDVGHSPCPFLWLSGTLPFKEWTGKSRETPKAETR